MNQGTEFDWMRTVLTRLYDGWSAEQAMRAIQSGEQLEALRVECESGLVGDTGKATIPSGDYGNNLLLALLALRTKFPRDEGLAKLETNLAMRSAARGDRRSAP
jgi:hypothetical protein